MKSLFIIFISIFSNFSIIYGQEVYKHKHCKCEDNIEQLSTLLNGQFIRECNGTEIINGNFKDGLKDGLWLTRSKNKSLIRKINYNNGVLDKVIELFYSSGVLKMRGNFDMGLKDGKWTYYNEKGKVLKEGNYNKGKPIGVWTVYDLKSKKELVAYDFDKAEYLINNSENSIMEKGAILQNDNTAEWFIRHTHQANNEKYNTKPFEGYLLSTDLHVLFMEIPIEIWETYVSYNFTAHLKFEKEILKSVSVKDNGGYNTNQAEIGFFATTNDAKKLSQIDHNDLTFQLLTNNIEEAIWLMGPWIVQDAEIDISLPYVINQFENSPFK